MSFGHALYYPHINLTNKNWVKHSLLFWDKISRIVPSSVEPSDNEDITSIKYHTGFIEDYHPENYDTSNAFNQFSDQLRHILESDHFFHDRYFKREKHRRDYRRDYYERRNFYSDMAKSSGTISILFDKTSDEIYSSFFLMSSMKGAFSSKEIVILSVKSKSFSFRRF